MSTESQHELRPNGKRGHRLCLCGHLGVADAAGLKDVAEKAVRKRGRLTIDLGKVEAIDLSGLQILLAVRDEVTAKNRELVIEGVSESLAESFRTAGVTLTPQPVPLSEPLTAEPAAA